MIFSECDYLEKSVQDLEATLSKAWSAKDYSKLVPVKKQDANGKMTTVWVLPEEAGQQSLFDEKTGGRASESGSRGYHDAVDKGTEDALVKPLIDKVKEVNPDLADKFAFKYSNYPFDRDTKELDVKVDYETAWYLRKIKEKPEYADEWQSEYNEKVDRLVRQLNNRKKAMLKVKPGDKVTYRGKEAFVTAFSKRGFPIVDAGGKEVKAFWEEVAS